MEQLSMPKKAALGKGLSALIQSNSNEALLKGVNAPSMSAPIHDGRAMEVDPKLIRPRANQPRKLFRQEPLDELAQSIRENGIIQPLVVTKSDAGFELVSGERRLKASMLLGLEKVPVVVVRGTDMEIQVKSLIENIQRENLNCVEEALAYHTLLQDYGLTQEELAKRLGKQRSSIANFLRILKLPRQVLEFIQREKLTFGHAKVLAADLDHEKVIRLANQAVEKNLSVRELEELMTFVPSKEREKRRPTTSLSERMDEFKSSLEKKTGYHFALKCKHNGAGVIAIRFSNEAEFNDVYEFLMKR